MTPAELRRFSGGELSHLKFDKNQKEPKNLLENAGERVKDFFDNFSSTSAKEQVTMQRESRLAGFRPPITSTKNFNYLILPRTGTERAFFQEYRTDDKNRPIDSTYELGKFLLSYGYAGLCVYLHPSHQRYSEFRYLGRETTKSRSHVIAFAQKPEFGDYLAQFSDITSSTTIRFLVQGLVWLDPDSFQIMRVLTRLYHPEAPTILEEQITDVIYQSVQLEKAALRFWLPKEVNVSWHLPGYVYFNRHRYSNYRLFTVAAKISLPAP